jgi:hypothetical protein
LGVHALGVGDDPCGQILQRAEKQQAAFTGKLNSFRANVAKAGKVVYFVRRPAPEVREDWLGLGVRRLGLGLGRARREGDLTAGQFNEFPAGVFLWQAGCTLEKIHRVPGFPGAEVIPQSPVRVHAEAGLVIFASRATAACGRFAGEAEMNPKGEDIQPRLGVCQR